MDFASLMSAQIAKSQKQQSPPSASSASNGTSSTKYQKRSEVEAAREAAYAAEQKAREAERLEKAEKKRKHDELEAEREREREAKRRRLAEESKKRRAEDERKEEVARRKRLGLPPLPPEQGPDAGKEETPLPDGEEDMADEDLTLKLREMSEPARLFGESHKQRLRRFRRLTGQLSRPSTPAGKEATRAKGPIPTTLEPVAEEEMKVEATVPPESDVAGRLLLSRQMTSWFTLVLREWALALAGRSDETKKTFSGQAAANSLSQAIEHLRPLYRKLEKMPTSPSELPEDLLAPMVEIILAAQERRYVDANNGYLKLSIGKAAWPIGVTMVGIHERSAREKLHESDKGKAHIMSDEATRKILQSIKRCLSFAQTRWPPTDIGQLMG